MLCIDLIKNIMYYGPERSNTVFFDIWLQFSFCKYNQVTNTQTNKKNKGGKNLINIFEFNL